MSRSNARPAWGTACATCRPPPRSGRSRSWYSPEKGRRRAPPATCPKRRRSTPTSPRSRRRCVNDRPAFARFRAGPDTHHPALLDRRARYGTAAADGAIPRDLRVVARDDLARQGPPRHRLPRDREGEPAEPPLGDPLQAPVGLGDARLPGDLPAAGPGAEARAAVDSVFRLGPRSDEPDRDRPRQRRPGAQADGRVGPRTPCPGLLDRDLS